MDISTKLDAIFDQCPKGVSSLAILMAVQKEFHYIPDSAFGRIAERFNLEEPQLRWAASFYDVFKLGLSGRYIIRVCGGPNCTSRKKQLLVDEIRKLAGMEDGDDTSRDGRFSLMTTGCMALCSQGPVVTINEDRYTKVIPEELGGILEKYT